MREGKRICITAEMIAEAVAEHREQELLLYAEALMKKGKLQNPSVLEQCIKAAEGTLEHPSMPGSSRQSIYQKLAHENFSRKKKERNWQQVLERAAVLFLLILVCYEIQRGVAYADKLEKIIVQIQENGSGDKFLNIKGDYTDAEWPPDIDELWQELKTPERYIYWKTEHLSESVIIYFMQKEHPETYMGIMINLYTKGIGESRIGHFTSEEKLYECDGVVYYMGSNTDNLKSCIWTDGPYQFLAWGELSDDELKEFVISCQEAMHKRS